MRSRIAQVVAVVCLLAGAVKFSAADLAGSATAGGGGVSSGGNFSVTGTIGQTDAGLLTGGSFAVAGGFWGGAYAVQNPGAPLLSVVSTGTNALFTWADASGSFVLESAGSLTAPIAWTLVPNAPTASNEQRSVSLPSPVGVRFYRLRKQ
jgi:hypothetical protein